ncbi:unnamed protein product [Penicillium camemberti]|uniref:Str. FM013 n=1 Tax=Penicillium camemberti (strain FM 013) TaxID=1429867 RepID=A0A0G4PUH8_PENC3|nr:unnamed protein product [Penicillium camemberti]
MSWFLGTRLWISASKNSRCSASGCKLAHKIHEKNAIYDQAASEHLEHTISIRFNGVKFLRCQRCYGDRSSLYHHNHQQDPVEHPSAGVCSRKRTGCAAAKENCELLHISGRGISQVYELSAN